MLQSRWAMSYLRGPLTRDEIRRLSSAARPAIPSADPASLPAGEDAPPARDGPLQPTAPVPQDRPLMPPDLPHYFLPLRDGSAAGVLAYRPVLYGSAEIRFSDAKLQVDARRDVAYVTPLRDEAVAADWEHATQVDIVAADLEKAPVSEATFSELPAAARRKKNVDKWTRDFSSWLNQSQNLQLLRSVPLAMTSQAGESERDFRIRLQQAAREGRDEAAARLRDKYAPKIAGLAAQRRRAEEVRERESQQVTQQTFQTAVSFGATLLGALMGRKAVSTSTLGRATTTIRGAGRRMKEAEDVERAAGSVQAVGPENGGPSGAARGGAAGTRHRALVRAARARVDQAEANTGDGGARDHRVAA